MTAIIPIAKGAAADAVDQAVGDATEAAEGAAGGAMDAVKGKLPKLK